MQKCVGNGEPWRRGKRERKTFVAGRLQEKSQKIGWAYQPGGYRVLRDWS